MTDDTDSDNEQQTEQPLTLMQLIGSALAAASGVQSSKNRARDFSRGTPLQFIIVGVLFTAGFVLLLIGFVNLLLSYIV
jgi:UPF0716 family protein affecting phage T7 exclusion